jgi:hypothetical protein
VDRPYRARRARHLACSISTFGLLIHRTWARPEAAELAKRYTLAAPNYAAVIETYERAKSVGQQI